MADRINVLVIGSGGREHAIVWKLLQSPRIGKIYIAPGNGGTKLYANNVDIKPNEIIKLRDFALENDIGLTIVGPEDPLSMGIVNEFEKAGLKIFGPTKEAAQIESSKVFAKEFMAKNAIPTASFEIFDDYLAALNYVRQNKTPLAVKADGLAAGKGVKVCFTPEDAEAALKEIMVDKKFGEAGNKVVIEEYLTGQEISVLALCDGKDFVLMLPSQDHKPVGDGDTGDNTGGMGAFAPVPWITPEMMEQIKQTIIVPTLKGLAALNTPFQGCLYFGLIITSQGAKVLEYNVRFGDPETQPILALLKSDLLEYMLACVNGTLASLPPLEWCDGYAVCIILASDGYPGKHETGFTIYNLEQTGLVYPTALIFHAGTKIKDGKIVTSGGRILGVTNIAPTLSEAINTAYSAANNIQFKNKYNRTDIGQKAL